MRLVVTLNDYPNVKLEEDFAVDIKACEVLTLTPTDTLSDASYKILSPTKTIFMPTYVQNPLCGDPISFKLTSNGGPLEPFMNFDSLSNPTSLSVQTNN